VVIVNHILWSYFSGLDMPSLDDLVKWGVDFIDVTTGGSLDLQRLIYARSKGLGVVAGTDVHEIGYTHQWTLLNVPGNITEEGILQSLKTRNTSFIFDVIGHYAPTKRSIPPENKSYLAAIPWLLLGQLFHSFYWRSESTGPYSFVDGYCTKDPTSPSWEFDKTAIFITVGWFLVVWLFFEIFFALIRLAYRKLKARFRPQKGIDDDDTDTPLLDLWKK